MVKSVNGSPQASTNIENNQLNTTPVRAKKKIGRFNISSAQAKQYLNNFQINTLEATNAVSPPIKNRKIAVNNVIDTKIRILKNQISIVKRRLKGKKSGSIISTFKRNITNEFLQKQRAKGGKRSNRLSKSEFKKYVKKTIRLNSTLIKKRGLEVVGDAKSKEVKPVQKAPHKDILNDADFKNMQPSQQEKIQHHIMLGAAAYKGFQNMSKIPSGYTLLRRDELPSELQMFYNNKTGLIRAPDNAKALIARKEDEIVLSFTGTEPGSQKKTGRSGTILTDITQWLGIESPMYQSAVAVLDLLLSHKPLCNTKVSVAGHSLGGGLAQFAYTAVQGKHDPDRLAGAITMNPAGLSPSTLNKLGDDRVNDIKNYIKKGKLWEAFESEERVVLLIDEIDKADIEFPNDLLQELDRMEFFVYELGQTIKAKHRPIVIITSNNEKELPDAFLRRCFFHYINFPDRETMQQIVNVSFEGIKQDLVKEAMEIFFDVRKVPGLKKKPSTSELIDWLKLLMADDIPDEILTNRDPSKAIPPLYGALVKNEQDVHLLERLAFMNRRDSRG